MRPERGIALAAGVVLVVSVLAGVVALGDGGVAAASHGPDRANFTVVPTSDRSPGAEGVRYGQRVVSTGDTDLETLLRTTATYEEGSFSKCGPSDSETFGIDRGATISGYGVDEGLTDHVKSFTAEEDVFRVEYYGEDDFGASTHFDAGDEFVSVATCIDNPDRPGWYRISGSTTGVTERGERVTYGSESHYFWICNCRDEAEARRTLGPPPSEPQATATPAPTPAGSTGDARTGGEGGGSADGDGESTGASEQTSPARATATPTGAASAAAATATPTARPTGDAADAESGSDAASDGGAATPTEAWDDHVLQTPTAAEGPGFGPAPALVAILGAFLLYQRRR